jgi:hypothetical protein
MEQRSVDVEKQTRLRIERRRCRRFADRQTSVFVRRTFPRSRVCAKYLICPRFSSHAKAFRKRGLTSRRDALNCALR